MQGNFYILGFFGRISAKSCVEKYINVFQTVKFYNLCYATY